MGAPAERTEGQSVREKERKGRSNIEMRIGFFGIVIVVRGLGDGLRRVCGRRRVFRRWLWPDIMVLQIEAVLTHLRRFECRLFGGD
jgi:hypothetical protein